MLTLTEPHPSRACQSNFLSAFPANMASKYVAKDVKGAGKGLFAACEIEAGSIVLQEERPLLAVLDSQHLKEACAWCFKYTGETDEQINLSVCTGCRILRYCDVVRSISSSRGVLNSLEGCLTMTQSPSDMSCRA
jgi:hypothetical protein